MVTKSGWCCWCKDKGSCQRCHFWKTGMACVDCFRLRWGHCQYSFDTTLPLPSQPSQVSLGHGHSMTSPVGLSSQSLSASVACTYWRTNTSIWSIFCPSSFSVQWWLVNFTRWPFFSAIIHSIALLKLGCWYKCSKLTHPIHLIWEWGVNLRVEHLCEHPNFNSVVTNLLCLPSPTPIFETRFILGTILLPKFLTFWLKPIRKLFIGKKTFLCSHVVRVASSLLLKFLD